MEMCLFPNLSPKKSYEYGCKCPGCIDGMRESWNKRKRLSRARKKARLAQLNSIFITRFTEVM